MSKPAPPEDGIIESQLTQEITSLWSDHIRLSTNRKLRSKELHQIPLNLAERLYEMKALLSCPGRSGQWRGWLKEQKIPRSTADSLVARHAETLGVEIENVPTGAISISPGEIAGKTAKDEWRRLGKLLTTHESLLQLIDNFAEVSGVPHEWRTEGLMIFNSAPEALDDLHSSTCAPVLDSPPSNPVPPVGEQPGDKPATTIPTTAQAASAD